MERMELGPHPARRFFCSPLLRMQKYGSVDTWKRARAHKVDPETIDYACSILELMGKPNAHALCLHHAAQPRHPAVASARRTAFPASELHAARKVGCRGADGYHPCLERFGDADGAGNVLREDTSVEAVGGVVGHFDSSGFGGEGVDADDGAKDLVLNDLGGVREVEEDGRGNEETLFHYISMSSSDMVWQKRTLSPT